MPAFIKTPSKIPLLLRPGLWLSDKITGKTLEVPRLISRSPLSFPEEFIVSLKENFDEREIVILASTAAQVNYWARLIQALGVPPAGHSGTCQFGGNDGDC